jgi:hypothetical protein
MLLRKDNKLQILYIRNKMKTTCLQIPLPTTDTTFGLILNSYSMI